MKGDGSLFDGQERFPAQFDQQVVLDAGL